jgi:hypothetical protein
MGPQMLCDGWLKTWRLIEGFSYVARYYAMPSLDRCVGLCHMLHGTASWAGVCTPAISTVMFRERPGGH